MPGKKSHLALPAVRRRTPIRMIRSSFCVSGQHYLCDGSSGAGQFALRCNCPCHYASQGAASPGRTPSETVDQKAA
jgi:hypothetical protein